jgi:hypothetical protein
MDLRQGQLIENDSYGSVSILKKAQPSSRSFVGYHTILEADTVPSGHFDKIVGVPREISHCKIPAGNL